jgi:hypothetical protein
MRLPITMEVDDIVTARMRHRLYVAYPTKNCLRRFINIHKEMLHLLALRSDIAPQEEEIQYLQLRGSFHLKRYLATLNIKTCDQLLHSIHNLHNQAYHKAFTTMLAESKDLYKLGYRLFEGRFVNFKGDFLSLFTESDRFKNIPESPLCAIHPWQRYSGWLVKHVPRKTAPSSTDAYYYSPKHKYRLDSMVNVDRFISLARALWKDDPIAERNAMAIVHVLRSSKLRF